MSEKTTAVVRLKHRKTGERTIMDAMDWEHNKTEAMKHYELIGSTEPSTETVDPNKKQLDNINGGKK